VVPAGTGGWKSPPSYAKRADPSLSKAPRETRSLIPEDVLSFIRSAIKSVWALELLLHLHRAPDRSWDAEALSLEMRSNRDLVQSILTTYEQSGLVALESDGKYTYRPASPHLAAIVDEIAKAYAATPLTLIKHIVSAPNEKIQSFADAFKFRTD